MVLIRDRHYSSRMTLVKLKKLGFALREYTPYSPDQAPSDFFCNLDSF